MGDGTFGMSPLPFANRVKSDGHPQFAIDWHLFYLIVYTAVIILYVVLCQSSICTLTEHYETLDWFLKLHYMQGGMIRCRNLPLNLNYRPSVPGLSIANSTVLALPAALSSHP